MKQTDKNIKILFTICGRAGSKGILNKNVRNFLDVPLPLYTIAAMELYMERHKEDTADIVLNTDSPDLISIFENCCPGISVICRDEGLAGDRVSKTDVIRNCLEIMETRTSSQYDVIIDMDLTSPLRTVEDIEHLMIEYKKYDYDTVFSITESRRNPYFNMVKKVEDRYEKVITSNYSARQQAPEIYDMNASLYAYAPEFIRSGKNIFDGTCGAVKMCDTGILDLDHEQDIEFMQVIAEYLFQNRGEFQEIRMRALKLDERRVQ